MMGVPTSVVGDVSVIVANFTIRTRLMFLRGLLCWALHLLSFLRCTRFVSHCPVRAVMQWLLIMLIKTFVFTTVSSRNWLYQCAVVIQYGVAFPMLNPGNFNNFATAAMWMHHSTASVCVTPLEQ